tara:strand:+ start:306 stop:983 length:678 start_codon:yes stop_codon:yes gene_type:complete
MKEVMKILKITLIAVISSVLLVLPSTAKELRIGVAAGFTNVNADGTETMKDSGKENTTEASENAIIPSIFAEFAADNGFGLGIEHVPGSADINSKTRSRSDDDEETTGDNTAAAEVDGLTSIYLIKSFENGFFLKVGKTSTTVNTKEVLATGSVYKNADVDGSLIGLGFTNTADNGVFVRVSGEYTDYDNIKLTSQTADAVTGTTNTIDASVDTVAFKLSVGRAF